MTKIIHLLEDGPFATKAIDLFDAACPGENRYLINSRGDSTIPAKYAKYANAVVGCGNDEYGRHIQGLSEATLVVVHNLLASYKIELIKGIAKGPRVHWLSWGGDLYCAPGLRYSIYGPLTERYLAERLSAKGRLLRHISRRVPIADVLFDRLGYGSAGALYREIRGIAHRIDSASAVIDSEQEIIAERFSRKIDYYPFVYGALDDYLDRSLLDECRSKAGERYILIGNSAYPSNNHLETFEIIAGRDEFRDSRILVPLAYGDPEYAKYIVSRGRHYFGSRFEPITQMLPLNAYLELIAQSGIVLMNQIRQQAVGNLLPLLYLGKPLFMNSSSLVYKTFRAWGLDVFDIEGGDFSRRPDVEKNRRELEVRYSRAGGLQKARTLAGQSRASRH